MCFNSWSNFAVAATKKKEDAGIFSDDDDFLGGLGIEDKGSAGPVPSAAEIEDLDSEEEEKPSRMFDKLLGKDRVSKHLETKEKKEFVLDKKYSQPEEGKYIMAAIISINSCRIFTSLFRIKFYYILYMVITWVVNFVISV